MRLRTRATHHWCASRELTALVVEGLPADRGH